MSRRSSRRSRVSVASQLSWCALWHLVPRIFSHEGLLFLACGSMAGRKHSSTGLGTVFCIFNGVHGVCYRVGRTWVQGGGIHGSRVS